MEDKDAEKKKPLSKLPDAVHSLNTYEIIWKYVTKITHPNDYVISVIEITSAKVKSRESLAKIKY